MNNKFIFFDLDGTLINTNLGITLALNETLKKLRIKRRYLPKEVKSMIGNGAKVLLRTALKREFSIKEYSIFLDNYEKFQYVSRFYPYVKNTLKKLKEEGYLLFIFSNKPDSLLTKLLNKKLGKDINLFNEIQGENISLYPKKPNPDYINLLIKKYKLKVSNGYYVGDSKIDAILANKANLKSIIVNYGYSKKNEISLNKKYKEYKIDYKINKFNEIFDCLD